MQIYNIKTQPLIYQKENKNFYQIKPSCDYISFGNKINFLELPKETIFKRLTKVLQNQNNFLGAGSEAIVYDIPGTNYCFRIPYLDTEGYILANWKSNFSTDIIEKEKINHIVANLGQGASIMNKIEGNPISFVNKDHKCILDFPSKSYGTIIKQVLKARENNLVFDCSCGNIIINPQNKTITAIDFNNPMRKRELQFNILNNLHLTLTMNFNEKECIDCAHKMLTAVINDIGKNIDANIVKCSDFLSYLENISPNLDKTLSKKLIDKFKELELLDYSIKRGIDHKSEFNKLVEDIKIILKNNQLIKKETE